MKSHKCKQCGWSVEEEGELCLWCELQESETRLRDRYRYLEAELSKVQKLISDMALKTTHPVCRCEYCTNVSNYLIELMQESQERSIQQENE